MQAAIRGAGEGAPPWHVYWLRPDPRRLAGVRYTFIESPISEEHLQKMADAFALAEGRPDQFWDTKWLRLRIEVSSRAVCMWLDGVLIRWVESPDRTRGATCLEMNVGDSVRNLRVQRNPSAARGYVPLDLKARYNSGGLGPDGDLADGQAFPAAGVPPVETYVEVGGVPFLWTSGGSAPDNLDVSKVTVTDGPRYIHGSAFDGEYKHRALLRVPSRQYKELAVIAATDTAPDRTGRLVAQMFASRRAMWVGAEGTVPAWNADAGDGEAVPLPAGRMLRGGRPAGEDGRLWLVRIPLDPGTFQNFISIDEATALDIDLAGTPGRSGVHVFAATLVESPVQMHVRSIEIGHVFVQPQVPLFDFVLRNISDTPQEGTIKVAATDFYGEATGTELAYSLQPGESRTVKGSPAVSVLGYHELDARLLDARGDQLIRRRTTFTLLPPDTRQADKESPFGMWTFSSGHYGAGPEASSELLHKLGVRWSHHVDVDKKIYQAWYSFRGLDEEEEVLDTLRTKEHVDHWTVFAESSLGVGESRPHFGRFPTELLEDPAPLELSAAEEVKLASYWDSAVRYSETVRKHYPEKKLVFGNGYPQFIISFLERGYPRKYLDGLALDFIGDHMNMFFYLREVAKHYGYGDVPLFISEGFYLGSGRGFHPDVASEIRQGDGYLRGFLRGFAMGMERYLGSCEPWDAGGDYYLSGYGPVGLCRRAPETNPKPGFAAYATMTRLLDRARFHSLVPTGSLNTYMLRFDGPSGPVYVLWTVRGRRSVSFAVEGSAPCLTDGQCNDTPLQLLDGRVTFELGVSPVWVQHAGRVQDVRAGDAIYEEAPAESAPPLYAFTSAAGWALDTNAYEALDAYDYNKPICVGHFSLGEADGRLPGQAALAVTLESQPGVSDHRLRYAAIRSQRELAVPAEAEALGVWVYGNGAATVDIELRDSEGEIWHTVPSAGSYGFGMRYAEPCAFDGWRYLRFALPPRGRSGEGNGQPDLPFTVSGILLEQYAKVLYINRLEAPPSPTWRIGEMVWE